MSTTLPRAFPDVEHMSKDRGAKMLDRQAQKRLGIPGKEFVRLYRAGELKDFNQATVLDLAMLLPFAGEPMNGRKHP